MSWHLRKIEKFSFRLIYSNGLPLQGYKQSAETFWPPRMSSIKLLKVIKVVCWSPHHHPVDLTQNAKYKIQKLKIQKYKWKVVSWSPPPSSWPHTKLTNPKNTNSSRRKQFNCHSRNPPESSVKVNIKLPNKTCWNPQNLTLDFFLTPKSGKVFVNPVDKDKDVKIAALYHRRLYIIQWTPNRKFWTLSILKAINKKDQQTNSWLTAEMDTKSP